MIFKPSDHKYFLLEATLIASRSKDPSTQAGAVIVRPDRTIAAKGYNGFPMKLIDRPADYEDKEIKYEKIIHCEMNALLSCRESVEGYTLYTYPFLSCPRCAVHMIQAGITTAVAPKCPDDKLERWAALLERTKAYFEEAGVTWIEI